MGIGTIVGRFLCAAGLALAIGLLPVSASASGLQKKCFGFLEENAATAMQQALGSGQKLQKFNSKLFRMRKAGEYFISENGAQNDPRARLTLGFKSELAKPKILASMKFVSDGEAAGLVLYTLQSKNGSFLPNVWMGFFDGVSGKAIGAVPIIDWDATRRAGDCVTNVAAGGGDSLQIANHRGPVLISLDRRSFSKARKAAGGTIRGVISYCESTGKGGVGKNIDPDMANEMALARCYNRSGLEQGLLCCRQIAATDGHQCVSVYRHDPTGKITKGFSDAPADLLGAADMAAENCRFEVGQRGGRCETIGTVCR